MRERRLRVALLGRGPQAQRWASALRPFAQICPPPEELPGDVDAIIIAPGTHDPFARAKEALLAGLPVLHAAPFALSPWQANALHALSTRRTALLRFAEPFQHQPGFAFLRRLLRGREPFWRPLYLRSLRAVPPTGHRRIDELATEDLAVCQALLEAAPNSLAAVACHRDEAGEPCAVLLILQYRDGPPVQCAISLVETAPKRELVAVTASHTVTLDDLDSAGALRIVNGHTQAFPAGLPGRAPDPIVEETREFVDAAAEGDLSFANSARWAQVAGVWWAARQSMSFGGVVEVPTTSLSPRYGEPPPLTVIQGGGRAASKRERPALTVIAG